MMKIFWLQKKGQVRIIKNGQLLKEPPAILSNVKQNKL